MGLGDTIKGAIRHVRGDTRMRMVINTRGVMAGYQHVIRIRVVHCHRYITRRVMARCHQVRGYNRMRMVGITRGIMARYHQVRGYRRVRMVIITRGVIAGNQHVRMVHNR